MFNGDKVSKASAPVNSPPNNPNSFFLGTGSLGKKGIPLDSISSLFLSSSK